MLFICDGQCPPIQTKNKINIYQSIKNQTLYPKINKLAMMKPYRAINRLFNNVTVKYSYIYRRNILTRKIILKYNLLSYRYKMPHNQSSNN